jgi:trypsin
MTFLVLKQSLILGVLLFEATSEAAVRGEWKTEHETLHSKTHHENDRSSRGEDLRKLGFILSEGPRQGEWTPFRSFPEVHHHHHHHGSSNQRKMNMNPMVTIMQMGKKNKSEMEMGGKMMKTSAPIAIAPSESPVASPIEEPPVNAPTEDAPTPTVDAPTPTVDAPTPTVDAPTPTIDAPTPTVDAPSPTEGTPTADDPTANESTSIGSRSSGKHNAPLLRDFTSRIVGGTPAGVNEFKFIASLNVGCGGSLIAPGIILSAAHCAGNIRTARIGSNKANSGGVVKSVTTECVHPNYQSSTTTNDYMLLKLDSPVDINQFPPIQLNNNKAIPQTNQILTVIGFGATSEGGSGSNTLLKVNVPANSHQKCNQQYGGSIVENVMFCAGELSGGKDSCQGDSGGPIFEIRSGKAVQVGVVSFGEGCARPNRSGVYSRVSGAYDWIQTTMAKLNSGDTSGCRGGKPSTPTKSPMKVPTPKPVKFPTKKPIRTKPPTESPTEAPVAPVRPPTSPNAPSSPTSMGVPSGEPPNDDDDDNNDEDDDSIWNWWSR